jgi:hypothetical protein
VAGITRVEIDGDGFVINGRPTYEGRSYGDWKVEGLLLNSRSVQATFDDDNPESRGRWAYPDTGRWDPERNVREMLANMPAWRAHSLLGITLNLQGGNPEGYAKEQPWRNSAITAAGELRPDHLARLKRVLDFADELGMVVILGIYYFGQDEYVKDEAAIRRGLENAVGWVLDEGFTNVLIEVNNECNVPRYEHEILQPQRVHELIQQVRETTRNGQRLLVGTSFTKLGLPTEKVVAASDVILLHGNGISDPNGIVAMVDDTRAIPTYRPMPIVFNEDDHFDFDKPFNNMLAAVSRYASWGYFDPGPGAGGSPWRSDYVEGYQNVPVNWGINTPNKRGFFDTCKRLAGV